MDKKDVTKLIALVVATVVFMGAVHVKAPAARFENKNAIAGKEEALDVAGAENIVEAVKVLNKDGSEAGYIVTVEEDGFGGKIVMEVSVDTTKTRVLSVNVTQQSETENLGAKIVEDAFRAQFADVEAPIYLPSMLAAEEAPVVAGFSGLNDGTYYVESEEVDGNRDTLELTVAGGKVTGIVWDVVNAEGVGKRILSEQGVYVMTEDGPIWKEQAEALAAAVIENQSVDFLNMNEAGKTDAVSGVSISVGGFVNVLADALEQAAGKSSVVLADGTYEAEAVAGDYTDVATMVVSGGKITEITLDSVDADGNKKSVLAEQGVYVMTEDGLNWKEQAEALAAAVVAGQSVECLALNAEGKTDAVSGVSIYVGGLVSLIENMIGQAAGTEVEAEVEAPAVVAPEQGTVVDSIIEMSTEGSAERNEALSLKTQLTEITEKELLLESLIKAYGFEDAVVVIGLDSGNVNVIAKSSNLTTDDAIKIYSVIEEENIATPDNVKIIPIS